ncbi:MAG: lysine--tRNA ligase, partial [Methanosarcinales archaeon]|nr:lysine--tRNA ligase [Candidatus Ethanoperedens thermophilum]
MDTHWADAIADQILKLGHKHLVASGITPSGDIHIGNMREVVTADAVYRALKDKNADVKLIYIADTFDPLRKVYPFLPDSYSEHIGKPLFKIPCPCGEHENYAEHFLQPFLQALEALEINAEILRADQVYNDGKYTQAIINTLEQQHTIAQILEKTSHRKLP